MSDPKLYILFPTESVTPAGFEPRVQYEAIRTVDAIDTDGNAVLNFLISNREGNRLVYVPSHQVDVCNWPEYRKAIDEAAKEARAQQARRGAILADPGAHFGH